MSPVVIVSAVRTPIGAFQGALASVPAPRLGAAALRGALERAGVPASEVNSVHLGQVLQAGCGQAPARQAAWAAGIPSSAPCTTVNKVCGSGLESIWQAARVVAAGEAAVAVAGGMESMSGVPYLMPKAREGFRLGHQTMLDGLIHDGLWDSQLQQHMGSCAEDCARTYRLDRAQQDAYAIESFRRAEAAQRSGVVRDEITPVAVAAARGAETIVDRDEGPARVKYEKIPTLRPAFDPAGTITAANASPLSDGAAALVLTSAAEAEKRGLRPLARLVAFGVHAQEPLRFTTAPVPATRQALERAGWTPETVDLWEVNEAFAVVPLAFMREFGVSPDRLNVRGGAIALGHPIGASGARVLVTLLSALRERGGRRGVAAVCIGGGEGLAVCVERL